MLPEQAKPVLDPLLLWGKWSAGRKCAEICGGHGGSLPHAPAGRKTNKLRLAGQMTRQPCILHAGSTLTFLPAAFCQDTRIP